MRTIQTLGYVLLFAIVATGGVWLKFKHCEWLAPGHVGYCMFFTK